LGRRRRVGKRRKEIPTPITKMRGNERGGKRRVSEVREKEVGRVPADPIRSKEREKEGEVKRKRERRAFVCSM